MKCSVCDPHGVRTPVGPGGVIIGRSGACSIVIDDPAVSRRHILLLVSEGALHALPLAKAGAVIDGRTTHEPTRLAPGAAVHVGPCQFVVEIEDDPDQPWLLAIGGGRYPITKDVFSLGGDPADDLCVSAWPPHTCVLYRVDGGVVLETADPEIVVAATPARPERGPAPETEPPEGERSYALGPRARFSRAGIEVQLLPAVEQPTTVERQILPRAATLELVPNGGLLHLALSGPRTVFLSQMRASLIAALLDPGSGLRAGEWIPDPVLLPRVWGREMATSSQLNVLIHRVRQSLNGAGLCGPELVQRAPGGGATRFHLAEGAHTQIC